MANVTITQLPQAGAITGTELVPIVQNGVTVQTTTAAISASPSQQQPFLVVGQQPTLPNSRAFGTGSGIVTTDGGPQGNFTVALTGAALSLLSSGNGIQVKTNANTLTNVQIAGGTGVSISNADGTAGNPTINLAAILQNLVNTSGTGLLAINGTTFNATSVSGTAGQIAVATGTTQPVISLVTTAVSAGSYSLSSFTVDAYGRLTAASSASTTGSGSVVALQSSPAFNGTPTAPTATVGTNTTQLATTAFVNNAISSGTGVVNTFSAGTTGLTPGTATSGNVVLGGTLAVTNGGTGVTTSTGSGSVVLSNSPAFTGAPTAPTAALNTNTTQLATTAFVLQQVSSSGGGTVTSITAGTGLTGGTITSAGTIAIDTTVVATLSGTQTLTNKTISGSSNTLSNIGNSSLTNSSLTVGTTNIALGATSLTLGGLTSVAVTQDPVSSLQLATKQYVDSVAQGLNTKAPVLCATTANITLSGEQTIDGIATSASRVLVKNQTTSSQNGIYLSGSGSWTRTTDANTWNQLVSAYVFVEEGSLQADTGWVCTVDPGGTIGVTAVTWVQFSGAGTYTAGTGLTLTGTQFSITNTAVSAGSYTNANITVNAQGQITSASNGSAGGVTSFQTSLSGLTPTTSTTGAITLAGTLGISSGGTGQTTASSAFNALSPITTTGDLIIGNGSNSATRLGIGSIGYVLSSNGTTASWQASTGGVTSFSAGTTGFTPSTGTTGAITLAGTLVVGNGGTGVTTLTGLAYGNGTSAFTAATAAQVVSVIGTTAVTNATNATTATNATNVAATAGSGATNYLTFVSSATGNVGVNTNSSLTYNYTNNALTAGINGGTF